jgi:hypothetical protein
MKTVLIGSDFMYDKDGNLKPIEINTNSNLSQNSQDTANTFDLTNLLNFITANAFTQITYIGNINQLNVKLKKLCTNNNLVYNFLRTTETAVTVPYVEDATDHLIIRSAYDTTALIDDKYCKDKIEFLKLISESNFAAKFAYKEITGEVINNITEIVDNGTHPNFILKSTLPAYNQSEYPKLLKLTNVDEINTILTEHTTGFYITPFHLNLNMLYDNHIQILRSFDLLYLPNLEAINLGATRKFCLNTLDSEESLYTNNVLNEKFRTKYLTDVSFAEGPRLLGTDKIIMEDGSTKLGKDIVAGDKIKSILIDGLPSDTYQFDLSSWTAPYSGFVSSSSFVNTEILSIKPINKLSYTTTVTFTDATTWSDAGNSSVLVKDDTGNIMFRSLAELLPGYEIIFYDLLDGITTTPCDVILKTVVSTVNSAEWFSGYEIDVLGTDLFFTVNDNNPNHLNLSSVNHNCPKHTCPYYNNYSCNVCPYK